MKLSFEILYVSYHHNRGDLIIASLIEGDVNFHIKDGAVLGGIPIYHYVEMPRLLNEDGNPRLDVFAFRPLSLKRLSHDYFVKGQQVELDLPD